MCPFVAKPSSKYAFKCVVPLLGTVANGCVAPPDNLFTVTPDRFSEKKSYPRWKARAQPRHDIAQQLKSDAAVHTVGAGWPSHWAKRDGNRFSRSAAATPSVRRREQRPQPRRGKVCGRARRRALFVLAELAWCHRQAREQLSMHTHMNTSSQQH